MKHKLDIESWNRKDHYHFFRSFEEPYHGINVNIDCTAAYRFAKANGVSFFLYHLYQATAAAQVVEAFKCRIEGDEVYVYDTIDTQTTVGRADGTFGFAAMPYKPTFAEYLTSATKAVEQVRNSSGLVRPEGINIIRFSSLPWINFTSLSHARKFSFEDSCPRISFGKMTEHEGKRTMPVSIHVNHALVDGLHVAQYIDKFQELMNTEA